MTEILKIRTLHNFILRSEEYLVRGEKDKAADCLKIALFKDPTNLEAKVNLDRLLNRTKISQKIPPILAITLPKSGTVFIAKALRQGLDLNNQMDSIANLITNGEIQIDGGRFPDISINYSILKKFASQNDGVVGISHLPPTKYNILLVNRYLEKVIVHMRDPRQALLSLTHHFNDLEVSEPLLSSTYLFPDNYYILPLSKQIDYQINNWLPVFIDWLEGWLKASVDPRFQMNVLFTHFEDMKNDPQKFFGSILNFYEIPSNRFTMPSTPKNGQLHFRKGEIAEWRKVFSKRQQQKVNSMIPQRLFDSFGWPP